MTGLPIWPSALLICLKNKKKMKLLDNVFEAHGGLKKWHELEKVVVHMVSSGKLFDIQGFPLDPTSREMTVYLHQQKASIRPFGGEGKKTAFTSDRIAIESEKGQIFAERTGTPKEIQGHMVLNSWDPLDRANFNGYAMWTYLTTPFFMAMPGVSVREIEPLVQGEETWSGLRVTFPPHLASHCTTQDFYFGEDHLLRRQDYMVDVAKTENFHASQYVYDMAEVSGILLPMKRRAYLRRFDGSPDIEQLMISIDILDAEFS